MRPPVEYVRAISGWTLSGADVLILLVLLASTLIGLLRGFVREAVSLGFWIAGVWAAWVYGPLVEPHLGGLLAGPAVRPWVGRLVVLIVVVVIGMAVGALLGHVTRQIGFGFMDRVMGLLFGLARGMVLVGLLVIGAELLQMNHESWWNRAVLIPYGETMGDWLRAMVGEKGEPWVRLERLTGVKVK